MAELSYVLKCLLMTAVITIFLQIKFQGQSFESRAEYALKKSSVSVYLQSVAVGGAFAARNMVVSLQQMIKGTASSFNEGSDAQKANR